MISLILPAFNRARLLDYGLWSLSHQSIVHPLEIVVINDYLPDDTQAVCDKWSKRFNIKYIFSGQRNLDGIIKPRVPANVINIGVKQCSGDIIILSCPEILHLNDTIDFIVSPLSHNKKIVTIPLKMGFDDKKVLLDYLLINYKLHNNAIFNLTIPAEIEKSITYGAKGEGAVKMPFLMGIHKELFMEIGGYDEDYENSYCWDDNDFVDRLINYPIGFHRVSAKIIHLYHPGHNLSCQSHEDNPKWQIGREIYFRKKGTIKRNEDKKWGILQC